MKMSIVEASAHSANRSEMKIEHGGQELLWNVSSFHKDVFNGKYDLCQHINGYWSRLPGARQEKIFELFQIIYEIFENGNDTTQMINDLAPQVKALFEEHSLKEIGHYIAFYEHTIITPPSFHDTYMPNEDRPSTREKTYTKPDYQQLVTLALALRIMIPIWGEFIIRTKVETGTNFKEFHAYRLLSQTDIVHSAPMEKLKIYVEHNIKNDRSLAAGILVGVGSEDYSEWLLSLVLVRRLCVGDISGQDSQTNLVTFIYNFIIYKVSGNTSTSFGENIRNKEFENGDGQDATNASRIENYQIKQDLPIGDIVILEHYMDNAERVGRHLMRENFDLPLLNEFLAALQPLATSHLSEGQVALAQWVLSSVISSRGITHLSKQKTIVAIGLAQTYLWSHGHYALAGLIGSMPSNSQHQAHLSGGDGRGRIPKDMMEILNVLYPYTRVSSAKQRTKPTNVAVVAIDRLATLLGQRDWILTLPDDKVAQVTSNPKVRRYSCPYDIKYLLGALAIELVQEQAQVVKGEPRPQAVVPHATNLI